MNGSITSVKIRVVSDVKSPISGGISVILFLRKDSSFSPFKFKQSSEGIAVIYVFFALVVSFIDIVVVVIVHVFVFCYVTELKLRFKKLKALQNLRTGLNTAILLSLMSRFERPSSSWKPSLISAILFPDATRD